MKKNSFENIVRSPSIGYVKDKAAVDRALYWRNEFPNNMLMKYAKLTRNKDL